MAAAVTPILLVAAGVLCVAAIAKLRKPEPAVRALATLELPASAAVVRALAVVELGLGAACALDPVRPMTAAIAFVYAGLALISLALARRQSTCGCFGDAESPASALQSALSAAFAVVSVIATTNGAHGVGWVLGYSPAVAATLLIAAGGGVYATVIAYTELPRAWAAWSVR